MATKEQSAALTKHWRHHIDAWKTPAMPAPMTATRLSGSPI
jgi:hypothetical protein